MPEEPYKNRELDEKFEDIKASLNRIETQTTKTNGSVANLKMWRAYTLGFIAALSIAFGVLAFFIGQVIVPIAGSIIQNGNHL